MYGRDTQEAPNVEKNEESKDNNRRELLAFYKAGKRHLHLHDIQTVSGDQGGVSHGRVITPTRHTN